MSDVLRSLQVGRVPGCCCCCCCLCSNLPSFARTTQHSTTRKPPNTMLQPLLLLHTLASLLYLFVCIYLLYWPRIDFACEVRWGRERDRKSISIFFGQFVYLSIVGCSWNRKTIISIYQNIGRNSLTNKTRQWQPIVESWFSLPTKTTTRFY